MRPPEERRSLPAVSASRLMRRSERPLEDLHTPPSRRCDDNRELCHWVIVNVAVAELLLLFTSGKKGVRVHVTVWVPTGIVATLGMA